MEGERRVDKMGSGADAVVAGGGGATRFQNAEEGKVPSASRSSGTSGESWFEDDRLRKRLISLGDLEESNEPDVPQDNIFLRDLIHLLNIFPEEIWNKILDNVQDSSTLLNLHNASPYFRNLLLPRRSAYLFPQVWSILAKQFKVYYADPSSSKLPSCYFYDLPICFFDWIVNYEPIHTQWFSGILNLRQVCRAWCEAVDKSLEVSDVSGATLPILNWKFEDFTYGGVHHFERHFARTHQGTERSPFLGRHVKIRIESESTYPTHPFPHNYGRHINSVSIMHLFPETYDNFRLLIHSMPNLKVLIIGPSNYKSHKPETLALEKCGLRRWNQFPKLNKLKSLKCHGAPAYLVNEILRRNSHVQVLDVDQGCANNGGCYDLYTFPLPNLQQLSIKFHCGDFLGTLVLPSFQPPLKPYCNNCDCCWEPENVFRVLEYAFGNSPLTSLEIKLPKATRSCNKTKILKESASFRLNLPKLVHLKVEISDLSSFDFLLPMKDSLETLELKIVRLEKIGENRELLKAVANEQTIKILGFTHCLLQSNIWRLFPKLNLVRISKTFMMWEMETCVEYRYTRRQWEVRVDRGEESDNLMFNLDLF